MPTYTVPPFPLLSFLSLLDLQIAGTCALFLAVYYVVARNVHLSSLGPGAVLSKRDLLSRSWLLSIPTAAFVSVIGVVTFVHLWPRFIAEELQRGSYHVFGLLDNGKEDDIEGFSW